MRKSARRWILAFAGIAVLGAGLAFIGWRLHAPSGAAPTGPVVRAELGALTEVAAASGTITPHVKVDVKSRTSGQVTEIRVKVGSQVKAGDLLVLLDPIDAERALRIARVALARAQADLDARQAELAIAGSDVRYADSERQVADRGQALGLVSVSSGRQMGHAVEAANGALMAKRAAVSSAKAALESATLDVEAAERNISYTQVFAPMAGTVLALDAEVGAIVASALTSVTGGTTLLTLADLSDLRVVGGVDEAQVSRVKPGLEVAIRVEAYPDRTFAGRVDSLSPLGVTSANVVTFDVDVVVTDEDKAILRPGMSADVEIVVRKDEGVLLVPLTAVESRGPMRFVTLASGEERPIETGATDGTRIIVKSGLGEGELVLAVPASAAQAAQPPAGMPMGMPPPGGGPPPGGP